MSANRISIAFGTFVFLCWTPLSSAQANSNAHPQAQTASHREEQTNSKPLTPIASIAPTTKKYLQKMRAPMHQYLETMLGLIPMGSSPNAIPRTSLLASDKIESLISTLSAIETPVEIVDAHKQLKDSLLPVLAFVNSGGLSKLGFGAALAVAQKMQSISDNYHGAVLEIMVANNLPKVDDPFLAEQSISDRASAPRRRAPQPNFNASDKSLESLSEPSTAKISPFTTSKSNQSGPDYSSMINGVDGAMGMSGYFNGLAGTGTNGLVDGLGFSSGLNGLLNGTGSSSGTSGFMNDLNVNGPTTRSSGH